MIILRKKIGVKGNYSVPFIAGYAICRSCSVIKPLAKFYIHKNSYKRRCIACLITYQATYARSLDPIQLSAYRKLQYSRDPQKYIQKASAFIKANPAGSRRRSMERIAMKLQRTPKWLNDMQKTQIKQLYEKASYLTNKYGFKYEVDHIIPLKGKNVSGLHVPWNLRILSKSENARKSNKVGNKYY